MTSKKNIDSAKREKVAEILEDFEMRREQRKPYELAWLLNINYVIGNQYSAVSQNGEMVDIPKMYPWESREVFNHIAPVVESRLAKLGRVRPSISVRPSGIEQADIENAKLSKLILDSVYNELDISSAIAEATVWSEVCGTSFYKIFWDATAGEKFDAKSLTGSKIVAGTIGQAGAEKQAGESEELGAKKPNGQTGAAGTGVGTLSAEPTGGATKAKAPTEISAGEVNVSVCSPFEIFPDSSGSVDIASMHSIIHARAMDAGEAERTYGVKVVGEPIDLLSLNVAKLGLMLSGSSNVYKSASVKKENQTIVIERWTRPSTEYPKGKLEIVVGDNLVFDGDMPMDDYPFVKQVSSATIGSFWGTSVVDRCIPLQRAYNAIKNRKIEFLSRLSGGVLTVEEGSVDVDEIAEDGLTPGKILVYRNGATIPKFMDSGDIPPELTAEEDRILNEFITLTGVSELMRNSTLPNSVMSGTAINLLIEQDDTRLSVTAENIRRALLNLSKKLIKLYKDNATLPKLAKVSGENGEVQLFYWSGANLSSDDVVLDTQNELSESPATRKNMVLELLKNHLLEDDNGKIDRRTKNKILEMLGLGNWEASADLSSLNLKRAKEENLNIFSAHVLEIDDNELHILEHTRFLLENEQKLTEKYKNALLLHIRQHKTLASASKVGNGEQNVQQ